MRIFKNKKGFTLVETVVALAIATVLLLGAMSIFAPVSNLIERANRDMTTTSVANTLTYFIRSQLEYSNKTDLRTDTNFTTVASQINAFAVSVPAGSTPRMMYFKWNDQGNTIADDDTYDIYDLQINGSTTYTETATLVPANLAFRKEFFNGLIAHYSLEFTANVSSGVGYFGRIKTAFSRDTDPNRDINNTSIPPDDGGVELRIATDDTFKFLNAIVSAPTMNSAGTTSNDIVIFYSNGVIE